MLIEHFLELVTKNKLTSKEVVAFHDIVSKQLGDFVSEYKGYRIVYENKKHHRYYIPLVDDLLSNMDDEIIESIMTEWEEVYSGKYYIETSTVEDEEILDTDATEDTIDCSVNINSTTIIQSPDDSVLYGRQLSKVSLPTEDINIDDISPDVALAIAKYQHQKWMDEKLEDGWMYSSEYDFDKKKHPLIIPWEQLPPEYQQIDTNLMSVLADILDSVNLKIAKK